MEKNAKRVAITVEAAGGTLTLEFPQKVYFDHSAFQTTRVIYLTEYEERLLEILLDQAGEYVSYADLTAFVYASKSVSGSNVIEVLIGRLRKKLAFLRDPALDTRLNPPSIIQTKRFSGYRIDAKKQKLHDLAFPSMKAGDLEFNDTQGAQ